MVICNSSSNQILASTNHYPEYFQAQIDIAWTKTMLES